jgi:hypothetical protein
MPRQYRNHTDVESNYQLRYGLIFFLIFITIFSAGSISIITLPILGCLLSDISSFRKIFVFHLLAFIIIGAWLPIPIVLTLIAFAWSLFLCFIGKVIVRSSIFTIRSGCLEFLCSVVFGIILAVSILLWGAKMS